MSFETISQTSTAPPAPLVTHGGRPTFQQALAQQNLPGALLAGLVAALVGAFIWAGITVLIHVQIGWMAIGLGCLVGCAVRIAGRGVTATFGIIGAILALLGCAGGNLLAVCGELAAQSKLPYMALLGTLSPSTVMDIMRATFDPIDVLFYGFAIYEGFKLSFTPWTEPEPAVLKPAQ